MSADSTGEDSAVLGGLGGQFEVVRSGVGGNVDGVRILQVDEVEDGEPACEHGGMRPYLPGQVLDVDMDAVSGFVGRTRQRRWSSALGVATSAMLVTTAASAAPAGFALPTHGPTLVASVAPLVLDLLCTGATLVLFYTLIARSGPARAALAFYLSPAFAVAFGAAFLHEEVSPAALIGLGAIVGGSILAAHRSEPSPP